MTTATRRWSRPPETVEEAREAAWEEMEQHADLISPDFGKYVRDFRTKGTGPLPPDPTAQPTVAPERQSFIDRVPDCVRTPEYRAAFARAIKTGFGVMGPVEPRDLYVLQGGIDVLGGYVVPAELQTGILSRIAAPTNVLGKCRVIPCGGNTGQWPVVTEHGTDGSVYTSGFVGDWVSEIPAADAGAAEPEFSLLSAPIRKARAIAWVGRDFVADADTDVLDFLRTDGAANLALVLEKGIIAGTGTGNQPLGILNTTGISTTTLDSGPTSDTIDSSTTDQDAVKALVDLIYSLPSQYAGNAVLVGKYATFGALQKLVDASGRYLWGETPWSKVPGVYSEFMQALGTNGNKVLLMADLFQVIVFMRSPFSVQILTERKADEEQIGFILRTRMSVGVPNVDALRLGVV